MRHTRSSTGRDPNRNEIANRGKSIALDSHLNQGTGPLGAQPQADDTIVAKEARAHHAGRRAAVGDFELLRAQHHQALSRDDWGAAAGPHRHAAEGTLDA